MWYIVFPVVSNCVYVVSFSSVEFMFCASKGCSYYY